MKRVLLLVIMMAGLFILSGCEDEEQSYLIEQIRIDAQIDSSGKMFVKEYFTYSFDGEFNGVSREKKRVDDFKGYLVKNPADLPHVADADLEQLPVEFDSEEDTYDVFVKSIDETKTVLFEYVVDGVVQKFTDVGELHYSFFGSTLKVDAKDVQITIHPPEGKLLADADYRLEETGDGLLTVRENSLVYENALYPKKMVSEIKLYFPADELADMKLTKDMLRLEKLLADEAEWAKREAELPDKFAGLLPIVIAGIVLIAVIGSILLYVHPARYRGRREISDMLARLEETDPLLLSYVNQEGLGDEAIIAALFSLKERGMVAFTEVDSDFFETGRTFRFTWINERAKVDEADAYFKEWLFTQEGEEGRSFLLDDIMDDPDEKESVREKKAEEFDWAKEEWEKLVLAREEFQFVYKRFRGFELASILFIVMCASFFYYLITIDLLTPEIQLSLKIGLGVVTLLGLLFSRSKIGLLIFYLPLIGCSLFLFTIESTGLLVVGFYVLAFILIMCIRVGYDDERKKQLKFAIKQTRELILKEQCPMKDTAEMVERYLMQAIVLGVGEEYAEQCEQVDVVKQFTRENVLLSNPQFTATTFAHENIILYSVLIAGSMTSIAATPTNISSGSGGGTGAF